MLNSCALRKYIIPFGKYKGEYLADVISEDPSYIDWIVSNNIEIGDLQEAIKVLRNDR